jgi:hypothetical protein
VLLGAGEEAVQRIALEPRAVPAGVLVDEDGVMYEIAEDAAP